MTSLSRRCHFGSVDTKYVNIKENEALILTLMFSLPEIFDFCVETNTWPLHLVGTNGYPVNIIFFELLDP